MIGRSTPNAAVTRLAIGWGDAGAVMVGDASGAHREPAGGGPRTLYGDPMEHPLGWWRRISGPPLGSIAVLVAMVGTVAAVVVPVPQLSGAQVTCSGPTATVPAPAPPRDGFVAVSPERVLDTRDGTGGALGTVAARCTVVIDLAGTAVPASASAVALSVTSTNAQERGFVTAHPCGTPRPYASNLNLRPGDPTPNLAVVPLDASRQVCLFTSGTTDLVADVTGWFEPLGGSVHPVTPARLLDTRTPLRPDGGIGPLPAGTVLELPVASAAGIAAAASAVAVNVTVDQPSAPGYVTVYPCGSPTPPLASNVNHLSADTRAATALVGLGGGRLCVFTYAEAHVVVDVSAWFDAGTPPEPERAPYFGRFTPVVGERLLDTRDGTGGPLGALAAGEERVWDPLATGRVPADATALVVNVTATEASEAGYVRLSPCESDATTSSVNVVPGVEATNVAVVPLSADGTVCVFSYGATHVLVDLLGAFTLAGPFSQLVFTGGADQAVTPSALDYTARCSPGPNANGVAVAPAPGTAVSLGTQRPGGGGDPAAPPVFGALARAVVVQPDDAIVVTFASRDGRRRQVWLRCLPPDFPRLEVQASGAADAGWYLLDSSVAVSLEPTAASFAIITDERGVPVWYRRLDRPAIDVHRQADGQLVWAEFSTPGFGTDPFAAVVVSELDGTVVQRWQPVGVPLDYHGTVEAPGGNRIVMAYERRAEPVDLTALGTDSQGNPLGSAEVVYDGVLQEIRPDGSLVWEWSSKDHVALAETTVPARFDFVGGAVDLVHLNSVQRLGNGDLLVSARHLDAVLQIRDPSLPAASGGGAIVRRFGGTASSVSFPGQPEPPLARPHDALLSDDGVLSVFDNRSPVPGRPLDDARGRAVRFALVGDVATQIDALTIPPGTASFGLGAARWQASGTAVVTWGGIDRPSWGEYDPAGTPLLDVDVLGGRLPYRVIKEPTSAFDRDALRATAGLS